MGPAAGYNVRRIPLFPFDFLRAQDMKLNRWLSLVVLTVMSLAQISLAEDSGITVTASGETAVKPNRLEIKIKASASAELTGDALVKYRDVLRRAKEAFDKLQNQNLQLVDDGFNVASASVGNPAVMGMPSGNQPAGKSEVGINKSLRLTVLGIDKLSEDELATLIAKLLDVAKDAGVATGPETNSSLIMRMGGMVAPSPLATFIADDPSAARKQAAEEAFRQAKDKAQRLAELAGAPLGAVVAIEEIPASTGTKQESLQERMMEMIYGGGGSAAADDPRLTSTSLRDLPVRVNLKVRFALQVNGTTK